MLRTAVRATNNKYLQKYPKLLQLQRLKNQHNVCMSTCSTNNPESENPQDLPHLPVPDLQVTLTKYLKSVKPFLNEDEFKTTQDVVTDFSNPCGSARKLQDYLLRRAETHNNWLEEWWLDTSYLQYREPVTIFSSPGQSFPFTCFESEEDRLKYGAKLILAAIAYKQLIDKKKIPVDKMGDKELDMQQYEKILGTCRIPACPKDKLMFNPKSKHICVAHNNHFFKVTVINEMGKPLSEKQLVNQLQCCLTQSQQPELGVGILTSQNRDVWAEVYQELTGDSQNKESVNEIQTSLFLVCLDKHAGTSADSRLTTAMKQFIHGGSNRLNSGNRWFDKTIQFVLSPSGEVGLTYEHSPSEGQPVAVMVDFLHNYIEDDMGKDIPSSTKCVDPIRLEFNLDDSIKQAIDCAAKNINTIACNLDVTCFKYEKYGKEFVKSQRMSPDSYIQMALQCAFYKIHKKPGAHYESAATRMYVGGRTETIRSCSCESIEFARTFLEPDESPNLKVEALRKAVAGHKKYTVDALKGCGVDRHMLGLKLAAAELKMSVPEIFEDIAWKRSSYMRISSSQVATKCDGVMGYAPLVKEGYGCCYNPRPDDINFSISTFEDYPNTSSIKYIASLEWCLDEMQKILLKATKSKM